ncbi:MAG: orotate phosphoribosyltransferase [Bacillus sp. (in: Bacteria)]|nr:orotate phosphoribosyltransferase [Bacillus sp. (in: firmicutes)]
MKKWIVEQLLEIGAVFLQPKNPFTWSSGIRSPIYCDNRLTLSYPVLRKTIAEELVGLIKEKFSDVEVIAGTATAGIPHATLVSDRLELPLVYVRSKPKDHGKGNQIEGRVQKGQKVVVIEDLISTGGSALKAAQALQQAGAQVAGIVSIFTYELKIGRQQMEEAGFPVYSLVTFSTLLETAIEKGVIHEQDVDTIQEWQNDPQNWDQ